MKLAHPAEEVAMATETSVTQGSQSWAEAHPLPFGSSVPEFKLLEPATDRWRTSQELHRNAIFAVFFVCNHCPHSRAWEPRLIDLAREFADRVNYVFISPSNPEGFREDGPDAIAEHARTERFPVPYLIDPDQTVADAFSAVRTPHAF